MLIRRNSLYLAAFALACGSTVAAFGCKASATVGSGEAAAPTASSVAEAPPPPPPPADTDGDGIPDDKDACKDKAGKENADAAKNGCPEEAPKAMAAMGKVKIENNEVKISEKIMFDTGKATIKPESDKLLDEIAQFLKDQPDIGLIEVGGHADKQGDAKKNVELTQARATAVVDALVKRGVDPKKLRSKGYGAYCPEDPGTTPEAYEKNRRVQFAILKMGGKKTGFKLGCDEAVKAGVKPQAIL
jgi:outer membrane protein OmpA-like peptidoglycan-associated protein